MRLLVSVATLLGLSASNTAAAFDPLQQYRSLTPAPVGVALSNANIVIGRMTFEVQGGTLFPLLDPVGEPNGALFEGHGTYRYRCDTPNNLIVFPGSLDRVAKSLPHSDKAAWDDFTRFALIGVSVAIEAVWESDPSVALTDSATRCYRQCWNGV